MKKQMGILQAGFGELTPTDLDRMEKEGRIGIVNGDAQKVFVWMNIKPFFPELGIIEV